MIVFDVKNGRLLDPGGYVIGPAWSGHGAAANDQSQERVQNVGPIPRGLYDVGPMIDGGHLGPNVMALTPVNPAQCFGRSGFYMHGDTVGDIDHVASDGCIIASLPERLKVNAASDRRLNVI